MPRSPATIANSLLTARPYRRPWKIVRGLLAQRDLLWLLTVREVQGRYRGSYLGLGWAFVVPLLMVAVYAVVFSVIFTPRWPNAAGGIIDFALILFTGMAVFGTFAEAISRAPTLILAHRNYVKKVVFPLDLLPVPIIASASLHAGVSLLVVLIGVLCTTGRISWTVIFVPFWFVPVIALTLGASWLVAALGVFVRDLASFMTVFVQALFFLTPIVYPIATVPGALRFLLWANPLTAPVEGVRGAMLWNTVPDWPAFALTTLVSLVVMVAGHAAFATLREGFAEVV